MKKLRFILLAAGMLAVAGGSVGQDKKDTKPADPPAKVKGQLPPNWGKIGLTDDQKQKVYAIDAKFDDEIDKLKAKIEELKKKKYEDQLAVLTAEQKKTLIENAKKKAGGGS